LLSVLAHDDVTDSLAVCVSLTMNMPAAPAGTRGVSNIAFSVLGDRYHVHMSRLVGAHPVRTDDGAYAWQLGS